MRIDIEILARPSENHSIETPLRRCAAHAGANAGVTLLDRDRRPFCSLTDVRIINPRVA